MTVYDTIKPALVAALKAVDPAMRVYDYMANPNDTSAARLFELFGVLDENGNVPIDAAKRVFNFVTFTRRRPGRYDNVFGTGPQDEVRYGQSDWQIDIYQSVQDPTVSPEITIPSEYGFQEKLDALARELFLNSAITSLMTSKYNLTVQSVDMPDCWFALVGNQYWCHTCSLTWTAKHLMNKGTF
jgi:hypothetical protein